MVRDDPVESGDDIDELVTLSLVRRGRIAVGQGQGRLDSDAPCLRQALISSSGQKRSAQFSGAVSVKHPIQVSGEAVRQGFDGVYTGTHGLASAARSTSLKPCDGCTTDVSFLPQVLLRDSGGESGTRDDLAELTRSLDYFPFPFDIWLSDATPERLPDRMRGLLMGMLQRQQRLPAATEAARQVGISPASLRRRLRSANTSFAEIRVGCQREWAEYLLAFTHTTTQDIAAQLGYADDRVFRRAFRQWTGRAPADFRACTAGSRGEH